MAYKYSSTARVQGLLPKSIDLDETTIPSIATMESWAPGVEGKVDLSLRTSGSTTPVTEATQVEYLDLIVAQELAWMVMYANNAAANDHDWHVEFKAACAAIAANGLDATASAGPSSYTMSAPSSSDPSINPVVTNDMVF